MKIYRIKREGPLVFEGIDRSDNPPYEIEYIERFPEIRITPKLFGDVHHAPNIEWTATACHQSEN